MGQASWQRQRCSRIMVVEAARPRAGSNSSYGLRVECKRRSQGLWGLCICSGRQARVVGCQVEPGRCTMALLSLTKLLVCVNAAI